MKAILARSGITGAIPTDPFLTEGEVALNYTDGVVYFKDHNGNTQSKGGETFENNPNSNFEIEHDIGIVDTQSQSFRKVFLVNGALSVE